MYWGLKLDVISRLMLLVKARRGVNIFPFMETLKHVQSSLLADNGIHYTRGGTLHLFDIKRLKTQHSPLSKPIYDGQFVVNDPQTTFLHLLQIKLGEEVQNVERQWWGRRYNPE